MKKNCFYLLFMAMLTVGLPVQCMEPDDVLDDSGEAFILCVTQFCNDNFYEKFERDSQDFISFLEEAKKVGLSTEKTRVCLRMFYNNIKSCEIIDHVVVEEVLVRIPALLGSHFHSGRPDEEEDVSRDRLRQLIVQFVELMLSKMFWHEEFSERIWDSIILISDDLHVIGQVGIIKEQDSLDSWWWSLTRRFIWFLGFKGSSFTADFSERIKDDLRESRVFFLAADGQDVGLTTKKDCLLEAIEKAQGTMSEASDE